jgi:hypothetical protein
MLSLCGGEIICTGSRIPNPDIWNPITGFGCRGPCHNPWPCPVTTLLDRFGMPEYTNRFLAEGFNAWDVVRDITEADLTFLGIGMAHRKRLQQEILAACNLFLPHNRWRLTLLGIAHPSRREDIDATLELIVKH